MYIEDLIKERNKLVINDLETSIKDIIIDDLICTLENSESGSKITFDDNKDIDDIVYDLEEYVSEEVSNYLCNSISIVSTKEVDGTCL